jgi:hypothetical protein
MKCKLIKIKGTWRQVADSANTTIHREEGIKEPSSQWKRRMLLAEHSPVRQITVKAKWYDLKYWVSVHLVRHKIGVEHWVRTQRTDRTGTNRDNLPQGNLVEHEIEANAQAIINISRKRLCNQASKETREAWQAFLDSFKDKEPELYSVCVKECIYRGFCPEYNSCSYHKTKAFEEELAKYRENINT